MQQTVEQSGRSRTRLVLRVSLLLNLLLGTLFALGLSTRSHRHPVSRSGAAAAPALVEAVPETNEVTLNTVTEIERFDWSQLESGDYPRYIANLRAVGCPEQTIREIIIADVTRQFALQRASLRPNVPFWASGKTRRDALTVHRQEVGHLATQERALIQQLLQIDSWTSPQDASDLVEEAIQLFLLGPMPMETSRRVLAEFKLAQAEKDLIADLVRDQTYAQENQAFAQLQAEHLQRLRGILSPAQFQEFYQRVIALKLVDDALGDFEPTVPEMRGMASIAFGLVDFEKAMPVEGLDRDLWDPAAKMEMASRFRNFLGASRFTQLLEQSGKGFFE
jgi:HAMP domain-containing protein